MVFAVDLTENKTVWLIADEVSVKNNGYGGQIATFYKVTDNLKARDEQGHIYADFNARINVGSYYLDRICGYRVASGIKDEEFEALNREYFFDSAEYEITDDDEGGEEVAV